jgi:hypothetical protein
MPFRRAIVRCSLAACLLTAAGPGQQFAPRPKSQIGGPPDLVVLVAADFDWDGDVDLLAGGKGPGPHGQLHVLLRNDGNGIFATPAPVVVGALAR